MDGVPPAVYAICNAITTRALARCEEKGIPPEVLYQMLIMVQKESHSIGVVEMFDEVFTRLKGKR